MSGSFATHHIGDEQSLKCYLKDNWGVKKGFSTTKEAYLDDGKNTGD